MRPNRPEQPTVARQNRHSRSDNQVRVYEEGDIPAVLEGKESPLVLILDCVQDPHNLGACLRTADAAGRDFWAQQLRTNGGNIELVAEAFLGTDEYFALAAK